MAAFDRLIICVDNSASMDGPKIRNSVKFLNDVVNAFGCTTQYFKFGCNAAEISSQGFNNLVSNCDDGTQIQKSLNQLFGNLLRKYAGYNDKTKFIFVTDAEDTINDANGVISVKRQCESAFGYKLDCECLLTGSDPECSSELKQIFGYDNFYHCTDHQFKTVLQKLTGGIKTANKISQSSEEIENEIEQVKQAANDEATKQLTNKMEEIMNTVNKCKEKTNSAKIKIDNTKRNLESAISTKNNISYTISSTPGSMPPEQINTLTTQIKTNKKEFRDERRNLNSAERDLNEAQKGLLEENKKTEQIANQLSTKTDELSKKASLIIANILSAIKELNNITHGAHQQISELQNKFNIQLEELMTIVQDSEQLSDEFERCQQNIDNTFNSLKDERTELDDFRKRITNNINELNGLLQKLNNKW